MVQKPSPSIIIRDSGYGKFIALGIVMTILIAIFSLIMSLVAAARNDLANIAYDNTAALYGGPVTQSAPSLNQLSKESDLYTRNNLTPVIVQKYVDNTNLISTDANVVINADFVKKGLMYQPTYRVNFEGNYNLKNTLNEDAIVAFDFPFPSNIQSSEISNAKITIDGVEVENAKKVISTSDSYGYTSNAQGLHWEGSIAKNSIKKIFVSYETVGISTFDYEGIENSKGAQDFKFALTINGTRGYDVKQGLSVDSREFGDGTVKLNWDKKNLFSKPTISVSVAQKLNPSTQVSRIYLTMAPIYVVFIALLVFLSKKFNTKFGLFDMFLVSILFGVFFPLVHYLSSFTIDPTMEIYSGFKSVNEFSMPLYLAFVMAWGVISALIVYLMARVTRPKFTLGIVVPELILFLGFFPLVVTIPEYSILLVLIGVIAILTIIVQARSMRKM